jgi:hypothetical protein
MYNRADVAGPPSPFAAVLLTDATPVPAMVVIKPEAVDIFLMEG